MDRASRRRAAHHRARSVHASPRHATNDRSACHDKARVRYLVNHAMGPVLGSDPHDTACAHGRPIPRHAVHAHAVRRHDHSACLDMARGHRRRRPRCGRERDRLHSTHRETETVRKNHVHAKAQGGDPRRVHRESHSAAHRCDRDSHPRAAHHCDRDSHPRAVHHCGRDSLLAVHHCAGNCYAVSHSAANRCGMNPCAANHLATRHCDAHVDRRLAERSASWDALSARLARHVHSDRDRAHHARSIGRAVRCPRSPKSFAARAGASRANRRRFRCSDPKPSSERRILFSARRARCDRAGASRRDGDLRR